MNSLHLLALGLATISLSPFATAEMRVWKSPDGAEIKAEFVSAKEDSVTLRMANGKAVTFGQNKLSQADRNWIKNQLDKQKAPAENKVDPNRKARWHPRMESAQREAQDLRLPMLVFFHDSAVGLSKEFEKEALDAKEFQTYANQHLVLLRYDRSKDQGSDSEANQMRRAHMAGAPRCILMNFDGTMITKVPDWYKGQSDIPHERVINWIKMEMAKR